MAGRRVAAIVVVAALGTAAVLVGFGRLEVDTSAGSLVPASDRAVQAWQETEASFGGDPVVVLFTGAGEGDLLAAEPVRKLVTLEASLAALPGVAVVYGPGTTANQVAIGLNELLVSITARRDGLRAEAVAAARGGGASEAAAKAAGDKAVADFETRYGSLVAAGLPLGLPTLNNPTFAKGVFLDDAGRARPAFRWIVPDDAHAAVYVRPSEKLDQDATERLVASVRRLAKDAGVGQSVTVTGAPVVAVSLGAEVRRELPRLGLVALLAVALAFLLSHRLPASPGAPRGGSAAPNRRSRLGWRHVGRRLLPLGLGLAAAVLTLAGFGLIGAPLSLGTLAFLPVMLGVGTDLPIQAAHPAQNRTLLVAALAGAAGFAALALSPLPFVRHLGLALAAGVLVSALLALPFRPPGRDTQPAFAYRDTAEKERQKGGVGQTTPTGDRLPGYGGKGTPVWRGVFGAAGLLAAVGWALLPGLPIEARPDRLAAGLPALGQARAAEAVLGASGEVAVRVRAGEVLTPELLRWFRQAEEQLVLRFGDRLRPVVSPGRLLGWLGDTPTPDQIDAGLRLLPRYLTGAAVRSDRKEAVASFGLRLGDLGDQAALLRDVRAALPPPPAGARVDVTGLPVVASRAYDLLSGGRLAASLAGPLLAGAVLLIGLHRRRDALAALAAALLAIGWGVLALRVAGIGLSPLTVGLGSLTAAVGAELVVFTRERIAGGLARPWPGGVAAALTSAAGFAALGLSRLEVLREFGLVLAGSVLLALLAASIVIGRHASGPAAPPAAASSGPDALASVGVTDDRRTPGAARTPLVRARLVRRPGAV
ncbi:MAG: RND transporter [Actinobacteria bacterium]|nr:RND transporter [Actinomycetota bacterium]